MFDFERNKNKKYSEFKKKITIGVTLILISVLSINILTDLDLAFNLMDYIAFILLMVILLINITTYNVLSINEKVLVKTKNMSKSIISTLLISVVFIMFLSFLNTLSYLSILVCLIILMFFIYRIVLRIKKIKGSD